MQDSQYDPSHALMMDGNAVAGLLQEVFGAEMTANRAQCAHCGDVNMLGALLLFGGAMGSVLRCPGCEDVMMRLAVRRDSLWLDMQGISYLRLERVAP
jgi:hypothetical protein